MGLHKWLQKIKRAGLIFFMAALFVSPLENLQAMQGQVAYKMTTNQLQEKFYKTNIDQKISLDIQGASVEDALRQIANKTGLKLTYRGDIIEKKMVNLVRSEIGVTDALNYVLEGTELDYMFSEDGYLLVYASSDELTDIQVQQTITGAVVDVESGEALPGVNIYVLDPEKSNDSIIGTQTDLDGIYSLDVPEELNTLVFSYIGYRTQEVEINGRTEINIDLQSQAITGEELVVVGYGSQKRKDITGSVSAVQPEQIQDLAVSNFEQALKGQVAGVQIFQNSGSPSAGTTIRIRGNGSITAGSQPLYVIDGHPVTGGSGGTGNIPGGVNPLNNINPNHIESIDILKDASATAIYGSQGANGVVIITTKSGIAGRRTFNLDMSTGWQTATKKLDRLNAQEFAEYHMESRHNGWVRSGGDPNAPNEERGRFQAADIYFNQSEWNPTDWQDEVLRTGMIQNYNLSASGGTENVSYAIMGGYLENQGIIIESSMKKYDFRANIDADITEDLQVGFRLNPSFTTHDQVSTEGHFRGSLLGMALSNPPIIGPYQPDGSYTNISAMRGRDVLGGLGALDNPIAHAKENQFDAELTRILGNVFIDYQILETLSFRSSLGIDGAFNRTNVFLSSLTGRNGSTPPSIPEGNATSSQKLHWLNENVLTYQQTFKSKHNLTSILGTSFQKNDYKNVQVAGTQYPGNNVPYVSAAGIVEEGTANHNQWSMVSVYGRVNYAFDDRYLVTATLRGDGSSRFGAENKYGIFPSAAIAWRMSQEKFMDNVDVINDLKWRLSYGVSGNNDISNYAHIARTSYAGYVLGADQNAVNATYQSSLANPFLTWETKQSYNFGVDLSLFQNRVEFTADAYKSITDGLLLDVNIPAISGFTSTLENIGEVENKGLELAISTVNMSSIDMFWRTSFNISFNRNKILALGGSAGDFIDSGRARNAVGKPMGLFYARVTDGIFDTQEEIDNHVPQDNNPQPGDRKFVDVNGDGVVNNADQDFVGDPNPDFTFGFTNRFTYKAFELNFLINGSYGNDAFFNYAIGANLNGNLNQAGVVRGRWQSPENPGSGNVPKAVNGFSTLADTASDFYVFDASYIRLTNLALAYNIQPHLAERVGLQGARLSLSGQNLITLTSYPGFDPEIASSGSSPISFGDDRGIYPLARVITLGLNVTF